MTEEDRMPLLPAILLCALPVVIVAGIAVWHSPWVRLRHWRRWVRELPEHVGERLHR